LCSPVRWGDDDKDDDMADVVLVLVTLAFFGLGVLLVRACDSLIGPDTEAESPATALDEPAVTA